MVVDRSRGEIRQSGRESPPSAASGTSTRGRALVGGVRSASGAAARGAQANRQVSPVPPEGRRDLGQARRAAGVDTSDPRTRKGCLMARIIVMPDASNLKLGIRGTVLYAEQVGPEHLDDLHCSEQIL